MTNADKIRSMTIDELVQFIYEPADFFDCNQCARLRYKYNEVCTDCTTWIRKFLEQEYVER